MPSNAGRRWQRLGFAALRCLRAGLACGRRARPCQAFLLLLLAGCAPALPPHWIVPVTAEFGAAARARATAIRLDDGRLLSAAHILDEAGIAEGWCRLGRTDPPPALTMLTTPDGVAHRLRAGRARLNRADCELAYLRGEDLAVLAAPALPGAAVCAQDPAPGQRVLVGTRDRIAAARLQAEVAEANPAFGQYAVLPLRLEPGESGGGVFDADSLCLLGIVSQRALHDPDAAWIVPARVIRGFLAAP